MCMLLIVNRPARVIYLQDRGYEYSCGCDYRTKRRDFRAPNSPRGVLQIQSFADSAFRGRMAAARTVQYIIFECIFRF